MTFRSNMHEPVGDGDVVKRRLLLIGEIKVRNPDLLHNARVKLKLGNPWQRGKSQPGVVPRLPEKYANGVVLQKKKKKKNPVQTLFGKEANKRRK